MTAGYVTPRSAATRDPVTAAVTSGRQTSPMTRCRVRCRGPLSQKPRSRRPRSREPRGRRAECRETRGRQAGWCEGLLESLAVVLAFVGFGLLWAAVESRAASETRAPGGDRSYPDAVVAPNRRSI